MGSEIPAKLEDNEFDILVKCMQSSWFFMKHYVYTLERDQGEQRFPEYPYLQNLVSVFENEKRIVILKSRQMMVTWTAVAYALWEAIFRKSADILFLSKREDDAKEAIRRINFMFDRLPEYMKPSTGENNRYVLEFPLQNSRLMALPTHPHIGRTYSPTRIVWDEMASTPNDDEMFSALQPGLDGGGSFIGISTSQGPLTKHADLFINADSYGFTPVSLHYSLHPDKDESWQKNARRGMSDRQWQVEQEMSLELGGDRVYDSFQKQIHVLNTSMNEITGKLYRTIDFGYHTPVVLWAELKNGKMLIFGEWIGEDETVSEMVSAIMSVDADFDFDENCFEMTWCDPAGAAKSDHGISSLDRLKKEYFEKTGIELKISYRRSGVMAGVDLVRELLRNAAGEVRLNVHGRCTRTIADFGRYVKKTGSEEPKKDGLAEHTMDALRYLVVNLFQKSSKAAIRRPRIGVFDR